MKLLNTHLLPFNLYLISVRFRYTRLSTMFSNLLENSKYLELELLYKVEQTIPLTILSRMLPPLRQVHYYIIDLL